MARKLFSPKNEETQARGEAPVCPAARAAATLASTSRANPSWPAVAATVPAGVSSGRLRLAYSVDIFRTSLRISSSESPPTSCPSMSVSGAEVPDRTTTSAMYTPRKPITSAPTRIARIRP